MGFYIGVPDFRLYRSRYPIVLQLDASPPPLAPMDKNCPADHGATTPPRGAACSHDPIPSLQFSNAGAAEAAMSDVRLGAGKAEHEPRARTGPLLAHGRSLASSSDAAIGHPREKCDATVVPGQPGCVSSSVATHLITTVASNRVGPATSAEVHGRDQLDDVLHDKAEAADLSIHALGHSGSDDGQGGNSMRQAHAVSAANETSSDPQVNGGAHSSGKVSPRDEPLRPAKRLKKTQKAAASVHPSFKCIVCKRAFSSASSRQHHYSVIHSKGRPY